MKSSPPKGHTYEKPKSGGNKPSHMKHIPDHMLTANKHDRSASMTQATIDGHCNGGESEVE